MSDDRVLPPATIAPFGLVLLLAGMAGAPAPLQAQERMTYPAPSQELRVPSVQDSSLARAAELWREVGIRVTRVDSVPSSTAHGVVVRQAPPAGAMVRPPVAGTLWVAVATVDAPARVSRRVDLDAVIREAVALRPVLERVIDRVRGDSALLERRPESQAPTVPDVLGTPLSDAVAALERVGLQVSDIQEIDAGSEAEPGTVVRQLPAAGSDVDRGAVARLWVAAEPAWVVVPDVRDRPIDEAMEILARSRLEGTAVGSVEGPRERVVVAGQYPEPGTETDPGALVELELGLAAAPVDAPPDDSPDPTGDPTPAGPMPGDQTPQEPLQPEPTQPEPPTDTDARPDTAPVVAVPDLSGLTAEEAERVLSSVGLALAVQTVRRAPEPEGVLESEPEPETVLAQTPAPATLVPAGSVVEVDVLEAAAIEVPGWVLPAAVVLVGLVGFIRRRRKRRRSREDESEAQVVEPVAPPVVRPEVEPQSPRPPAGRVVFHPNPGRLHQEVSVDGPILGGLKVRLAPRPLAAPAAVRVAGRPFVPQREGTHD